MKVIVDVNLFVNTIELSLTPRGKAFITGVLPIVVTGLRTAGVGILHTEVSLFRGIHTYLVLLSLSTHKLFRW